MKKMLRIECAYATVLMLVSCLGCASLAQRLTDESWVTRDEAREEYDKLSPTKQALVQSALVDYARNSKNDLDRRIEVVQLLDKDLKQSILIELAKDPNNDLDRRIEVAQLLDEDLKQSILVELAKDPNNNLYKRIEVAQLLDKDLKQSILIELAKDSNNNISHRATAALKLAKINNELAQPILVEMLRESVCPATLKFQIACNLDDGTLLQLLRDGVVDCDDFGFRIFQTTSRRDLKLLEYLVLNIRSDNRRALVNEYLNTVVRQRIFLDDIKTFEYLDIIEMQEKNGLLLSEVFDALMDRITDADALVKIATNDSTIASDSIIESRVLAIGLRVVEKLNTQSALCEVALNGKRSEVRLRAVEKVADQQVLAKVARADVDERIRNLAVRKLNDQTVLCEIAQNEENYEVRLSAVEKVADQQVLAKIACSDVDERIRGLAVRKLDDQTVLCEIAQNEANNEVRLTAVEKVADQQVLAKVARADVDARIRGLAVRKLNDQTVLCEIAQNEANNEVRLAAVEKVVDQQVLAKVARADVDARIRGLAVRKLDNHEQAILCGIAQNEANNEVRLTAVDKVMNQQVLAKIARVDQDVGIRGIAARKLDARDQALLCEIVQNETNNEIRATLIAKITDQVFLVKLLETEMNGHIRELIINNVSDSHPIKQNYYVSVAKGSGPMSDRIEAVKKLTSELKLMDLANSIHDAPEVVEAVVKKIENQDALAKIIWQRKGEKALNPTLCIAMTKISNQKLVNEFAQDVELPMNCREIAIAKVTNKDVLINLFTKEDQSIVTILSVVKAMADEFVLASIAKEEIVSCIRTAKLEEQIKELELDEKTAKMEQEEYLKNNPNLLLAAWADPWTALQDPFLVTYTRQLSKIRETKAGCLSQLEERTKALHEIPLVAFRKITNQALLADIAVNAKKIEIQHAAIERITEQSFLAKVAKGDCSAKIRRRAIEKLCDSEVLSILTNDSNWEIAEQAKERLKEIE